MSAAAVKNLQQIWGKLTFDRVNRVVAREPEDVLSIEVPRVNTHPDGLITTDHTEYYVHSRRTADIPKKDRWRARIAWRHYFGFTDSGIYFQKDNYNGLDCDISLTMSWSSWVNHNSGFLKPPVGSIIAGEVTQAPKGKRFAKWFMCPPELEFLIRIVLSGTTLTEEELAPKLLTGGLPDIYWAIARLVFFDNVQAFVDELKTSKQRPPHPCMGQEFPQKGYSGTGYLGDTKPRVYWNGMYLSSNVAEYVHTISYTLGEPKWWQEFKRLAAEEGLVHSHPAFGGYCSACAAERPEDHLPKYDW